MGLDDHPRPSVTVDNVVFSLGFDYQQSEKYLQVLLIKRGRPGTAFEGCWALPGGFVDKDEDLLVAALRELQEETQVTTPPYIEQLATFGTPGRDPRGHVISVAYMSIVRAEVTIRGGDDAAEAKWWAVKDLESIPLAFDHKEILGVAVHRLRTKIQWQPVGLGFVDDVFTLSELQDVYEAILGRKIDRRNFRRKVLSYENVLESASSVRIGSPGPAATLYRFNHEAYNSLLESGDDFEI